MASKQILAFLLVAMVATACVSGQGLNCWDRSNCQYCQYCNQRSQCNSGTMSSDAQKLCPCAFQCDNNCGHFCGSGGASGKRLLLGRGLNEVVDA